MNKTAHTEFHRLFLVEKLPDPLTPASAHVQIFDNYIEETRLRLRLIRDPGSKAWTRILQQRFPVDEKNLATTKLTEIFLNDAEYSLLEQFEGHEIRKNRYFHEFDRVAFAFDVYLGDLRGLNSARVDFDNAAAMERFDPPPFAVFEVTSVPFFWGRNLVGKKFEDAQAEVARIGSDIPLTSAMPDE